MYLAEYCHRNEPLHNGLRWALSRPPYGIDDAIEFAQKRRIDDASCAISGQLGLH
jgi:hypothetical protein